MTAKPQHRVVPGYSRLPTAAYVVRCVVGGKPEEIAVEAATHIDAVHLASVRPGLEAIESVTRTWNVVGRCCRPRCRVIVFDESKWWIGAKGGIVCEDCA